MATGNNGLTRRQESAIAALLTEPTVTAAADKARVAVRTLQGWLNEPAFQAAYRRARRDAFEQATAALQRLSAAAIRTLKRNLRCGRPQVEVAAALAVLDRGAKAIEQLDLATELDELRQRLMEIEGERRGNDPGSPPAEPGGGAAPAEGEPGPGSDPAGSGGSVSPGAVEPGPVAGGSSPLALTEDTAALFQAGG